MKKKILIPYVMVMIMAFTAGCSKNADYVLTTGFDSKELCRIDGQSCYEYEAVIYLTNMTNEYRDLFGDDFISNETNGSEIKERLRQMAFSKLLKVKVMNLLADDYQITTDSSENELIKAMAEEYYNSLSEEEKNAFSDVTYGEIEKMYKEYLIALKTYKHIVKDVNLEISDDEDRTVVVKQIYLPTIQKMEDGIVVNLTDNEKADIYNEAKTMYDRLLNGEDFDVVAMGNQDGNDNTISYNKGELDDVLEKKVFELSEGQISELIAGDDGYYIFYCVNPFSREDTDTNKARIISERQKETFENVFEAYAEDVTYYLNTDTFKDIQIDEELRSSRFFAIYEQYNINY